MQAVETFYAETYAKNLFAYLQSNGLHITVTRLYIYREELTTLFSTHETVENILAFLLQINAIKEGGRYD